MMEEIKACPFPHCGSEKVELLNDGGVSPKHKWVRCPECAAEGPSAETELEAILLWNAAAYALAAKDDEIEQLRKERHTMCVDYERVEQERDEARRVARRLYATNKELIRTFVCNPIATWREVYENAEQNGTTGVTQPSNDGN